jgi:hypothetical protein
MSCHGVASLPKILTIPRKSPTFFLPKSPSPPESPTGFGPKSPSPRGSPIPLDLRVRLDSRVRVQKNRTLCASLVERRLCKLESRALAELASKTYPLKPTVKRFRVTGSRSVDLVGALRPSCARPLCGPRVSSAAWHRLGCLLRGTTWPRWCTPSACTSQVVVCLLGAPPTGGTHSVSQTHLLRRCNGRLRGPSRSHSLPWWHTCLLYTSACAPPIGERGGVTGSDLSPPLCRSRFSPVAVKNLLLPMALKCA